ncbi:MAG: aminomethyl-transferring glycine dehydrogenase [Flavobacteriales bacterium]|nr:aminomethyl-transferring glycine dehydrogenase [Flavobacteriales bacterium]MCW8913517.1 aminomethyl-transferring glycine dehydrogenase [Flavobacteriales bacterium]MCW8938648.1 aminomethyl-transferring glycine dehydrogenase [Flavobacteriales bacterium]MCW8941503.1 aminomethyl-transferring glycine dehydrogenase [Flavobacteriales bacterium]MCW8968179.1 aminomethyl-transferring glycine dehydrogenase [Flavobacteriales bacterium]
MAANKFSDRHIGPREEDKKSMLSSIGLNSIEELISQTIPAKIRLKKELELDAPLTEFEYLNHITELGEKNKVYQSYIGLGYHSTITPSVIKRNIFENPGWYTAYTPYQAEISQGRLEALLNYQTAVIDLTGMELANASLLDEGTAAAEAMILAYNSRSKSLKQSDANQFFVSADCLPQTIDILKTRSTPLGIELTIGDENSFEFNDKVFGCILQYPTVKGQIYDYKNFTAKAHANESMVVVAADLLSLSLLTPPGEWGADVVVGSSQRFGVPMGYGGPHAAFFATKEAFKRAIPGRIIGVSVDAQGNRALRMALQTREQHIKRDKATSNICTAQVLLSVMAGMYAVYHGAEGIKNIATTINKLTAQLAAGIDGLGLKRVNHTFFDTLTYEVSNEQKVVINKIALENKINLNFYAEGYVSMSVGETENEATIKALIAVFEKALGKQAGSNSGVQGIPADLVRTSAYLTHEIFNKYRSESDMMRYIKRLENKDLSLTHSMISLGSCTMKLNAASELIPLGWSDWANIHPFVPLDQAQGYQEMLKKLEDDLAEITGFDAVSLQPNSGAQGEYAGLMVIRAYHESRGDTHRNIALIPSSAHGTNPASAVMAGMKVIVTKCDDNGNIDVADLKAKAEEHADNLSCIMVTYPSTHGVYEESIMEITEIVHQNGGQVYMDGANMNAQVALTNPANIGADVCHLNLHKTFAIPHGGGGPGVGPIGVAKHLTPFLPSNVIVKTGGDKAITAISAAPWGSAYVCLISYGYIKMLGTAGLKLSTEAAILNANYLKSKLEQHYKILYTNDKGRVAHEMILECRDFKAASGVEVSDIAKRLMDYGFHAPTVSFPVAGTLMVEPTESESKEELDRFVETMIAIKEEVNDIIEGKADKTNNVLKNAPHTSKVLLADNWDKPYSRQQAAFPLKWVEDAKYWTTVGRVDDAYGDRNLVCSCNPIEDYAEI